jgi:hypothetical protein
VALTPLRGHLVAKETHYGSETHITQMSGLPPIGMTVSPGSGTVYGRVLASVLSSGLR